MHQSSRPRPAGEIICTIGRRLCGGKIDINHISLQCLAYKGAQESVLYEHRTCQLIIRVGVHSEGSFAYNLVGHEIE